MLKGRSGRDVLIGKGGRDVLIGGGGRRHAARRRRARQLQHARRRPARGQGPRPDLRPRRAPGRDQLRRRAATSRSSTRSRTASTTARRSGPAVIGRPPDHSSRLRPRRARRPRGRRAARGEHRRRAPAPARVPRPHRSARRGSPGWRACCRPRRWSPRRRSGRARKPLPKPRDLPIDTFVVLMMENRSFDHYFGWHPHADAKNEGLSYPNLDGTQTFPTHRLTPDFQGCDFRDPDHGWDGGPLPAQRRQAWTASTAATRRATGIGRVRARLLPEGGPRLHPARRRRLPALRPLLLLDPGLDLPEPPLPARRPRTAARSRTSSRRRYPSQDDRLPVGDDPRPGARARAGGRLLRLRPAVPGALRPARAGLGAPDPAVLRRRGRRERCRRSASSTRRSTTAAGATASRPTSTRTATSGSARRSCPTSPTRSSSRPQYRRGAMFINYDEWGGFFDHVVPPRVPDDRANREGPRRGLVADRLPGPGGRDLARTRAARRAAGSAT